MSTLSIGNRRIGPGLRTFVIAEIGVNHDGSVARALDLVRTAADCGADAIKLQIFSAGRLMHASAQFAEYQNGSTRPESPAEMLSRYELPQTDLARIIDFARELGLAPLATPFSPDDLAVIARFNLPAVKIASPDLVNRPLLSKAAGLGRPLLISTGAAALEEIDRTADWLREWNAQFSLMHCISSYPTPAAEAHLSWIAELSRRFDVPIGYSDHTTEICCGGLAVAAGATIIERHLTYDRSASGPDHAASSDPRQFSQYVKLIREAEVLCGVGGKRVLDIEQDVRRVSRQSLVFRRSLRSGEIVREDDLTVQRPGTGVSASEIQCAVGRRALRALECGQMLEWNMLSSGD